MFGVTTSDDYRPVAWMGRYPVDVTTMLVGVHVAAAILAAILVAFGAGSVLLLAAIRQCRDLVQRPSVAAVYLCLRSCPIGAALVRHRDVPAVCLRARSGTFSGPTRVHRALCFLLVTPAALLTIWGLWERCAIAGSPELHFGIFVAFATIYPRVEMLLRIMAKWIALILAAVYTFQLLAYHAWSDLMVLWTSIGVAFLFVELNGAGPELAWWNDLKRALPPSRSIMSSRNHERAPAAAARNRKTFTRQSIRSSTKFPSLELEASPRASGGSWIASANGC